MAGGSGGGPLGSFGIAEQRVDPAGADGQTWVRSHLVVGRTAYPPAQRLDLPATGERLPVTEHESAGPGDIAALLCIAKGGGHRAEAVVPRCGPFEQERSALGRRPVQLRREHLLEQVVVTEPATVVVERDDE